MSYGTKHFIFHFLFAVKKLLDENQLPHLLFYGPPGTGKTSTILALARQIYGSSVGSMTLELNASDDRGINIVRNEIQDFASTRTIFNNKFKLIILDECDAMTRDAQMALRRGKNVITPVIFMCTNFRWSHSIFLNWRVIISPQSWKNMLEMLGFV